MRLPVLAATLVALLTLPVAARAQTEEEIREYNYRKAKEESAERYAQTEANRKELEALRAQVMKQPPLPAAKNRLLGRWVMLTKSPDMENVSELLFNTESHMETMMCAMIFGEEEFEYRPDALVLGDAGGDIVADKIAYRAGNGGSVFALGDKLIRLLVFEFDAGPDRMRNGKCTYGKVKPKGAAPAGAASPAAGRSVPAAQRSAPAAESPVSAAEIAPAAKPRTYAGAGFKVAGATLGTDTPPILWKAITARGGTPLPSVIDGLGSLRIYGRDARWDDAGSGVYTVAFDFDEDGPGGQLIAVTLYYLAEAADLPRLLEQRAAALATIYGPMTTTSSGHPEGKAGAVRITLGIEPAASAVIETYRVR